MMATINGSLGFDLTSAVGTSPADRAALSNALAAIYGPEGNYGNGTKDGGSPASATDFYLADGTGSAAIGTSKLGVAGVNSSNSLNPGNTSATTLSLGAVFNDAIITGTAAGNLTGNANANVLGGNDAANTIIGNGGNDTVVAGAGNDKVTTTGGNDSILGGAGNDNINAGNGNNFVNDESGNDTITTGSGNDIIQDLGGTNTIKAGDGTNDITTGAGKDNIAGGSGNDDIDSGAGADVINTGSGGNDVVDSGDGNDVVTTGAGDDLIIAGNGRDNVNSNAGNDTIYGDAGNDTINGGSGDDNILGGYGSDSLTGGTGNDIFEIDNDGLGNDTINDFSFTTDSDGNINGTDSLLIDASDLSGFSDHSGGDGIFEREDFTLTFNSNPAVKGVTINFNDGGTVLLKNVSFDDLYFTENGDGTGTFELTQGGGNL